MSGSNVHLYIQAAVLIAVLVSATLLAIEHDVAENTVSTVYGLVGGYGGGITAAGIIANKLGGE